MVCYKCKKQIENDVSICPSCGSPQKFEPFIKRALRNDQAAFSQLYYMTKDNVYHSIKSMYGNEDAIEDIMQLTFIDAFTKLGTLSEPEAFRGWVKQISVRKTIDYLRKKDTRVFSEAASMDSEDMPELWDENPQHSPEHVLGQKENARVVKELLDSLPNEQRIVIGMYYYEEMTIPEIAKALNISEGTVKSRRRYGQKKIEAKIASMKNINLKLLGSTPASVLLTLLHTESASAAETDDRKILRNVMREIQKKDKSGPSGPVGRSGKSSKNALKAEFKPGESDVNVAADRTRPLSAPKGGRTPLQTFAPRFLTGVTLVALLLGTSMVFDAQLDRYKAAQEQIAQNPEQDPNGRTPENTANDNDQQNENALGQTGEEPVQTTSAAQNGQAESNETTTNTSNTRNVGEGSGASNTQENNSTDDGTTDEGPKTAVGSVALSIPRPTYGDTLVAEVEPKNADVTYQWYNSDGLIEGATGKSYTPTEDDVMKHLRVTITGKGSFKGTVSVRTEAPVQRISVDNLVTLDNLQPSYGDTVTAIVNSDSNDITYQWYNTDGIIEGATGKTYTPTTNDIGKYLHVYIIDSIIHTGDAKTDEAVRGISINGVTLDIPRPTYGDTITAIVDPADADVTYQWYNSDGIIDGATGPSYTPTENDIMKHLRVDVNGSGIYEGEVTVRTDAPVQRVPLNGATLDIPQPIYGDTVTAIVDPADAQVTYQWYNWDGVIEGATGPSYTPTENDIGQDLRVDVEGIGPYTGSVRARTTAPVQSP